MNHDLDVIYIHRFLTGELNVEEQQKFDAWLEQDPNNRKLFSDISLIWEKSSLSPEMVFDVNSAKARFKERISPLPKSEVVENRTRPKIFTLRPLLAVAASLILIMAAWFIFSQNQSTTYNSSQKTIANLEDGSKVWMSDGTNITYVEKNKKREVVLEGKAYFDVAPIKQKPFVISADGFEVEVLGTSFTVDGKLKTVFVKQGKVKVTYGGKEVLLTNNNYFQISDDEQSTIENREFTNESLWFNENLSFNNTPFDKVIEDLSEYFNVSFDLPEGRDWSKCTFTSGSLKNNTIDEVIITLRLTYELDCKKTGDKSYKVSRVKCR